MILYLNEDGAYLSWVSRHRHGFVLDALRTPTRKTPSLHRSSCPAIRKSFSKTTHWTTGRHLKACSLDPETLVNWASEEYGVVPDCCEQCAPRKVFRSEPAPPKDDHRLTRLDRQILDCTIESAVIHLDNRDGEYDLTVFGLAERLGKSSPQIIPALSRLIDEGLLEIEGDLLMPARCRVYPTARCLRSLSTFEPSSEAQIAQELKGLRARDKSFSLLT